MTEHSGQRAPKSFRDIADGIVLKNQAMTTSQEKEQSMPQSVAPTEKAYCDQLGDWGVLEGYRKWTLKDFSLKTVEWKKGFFIYGVTGSGKSCLASALLRDRMHPEHPQTLAFIRYGNNYTWSPNAVQWFYAPGIPRLVMDTWNSKESEGSAFRMITKNKIVVIDDLGSEKINEHTVPIMREVFERCVNGGIQLIVTSNFSNDVIYDKIDDRIGSRLHLLQKIKTGDYDMRAEDGKELNIRIKRS